MKSEQRELHSFVRLLKRKRWRKIDRAVRALLLRTAGQKDATDIDHFIDDSSVSGIDSDDNGHPFCDMVQSARF